MAKKKSSAKPRPTPTSAPAQAKINKVMREYKHHTLHSGSKSGPTVTNRKQAIAIALAEARRRQSKR